MSPNTGLLSLLLFTLSSLSSPLTAGVGGRDVTVENSTELRSAILNAQDNDNIILADGSYTNGRPLIINNADDVVIRSASGGAQSVLLTGRSSFSQGGSYDELDDILRVQNCDRLLIENVTFTEAHGYGIKLELDNVSNPNDVHIADCRFIDIGTRHIKGTQDPNDTTKRILGGSVRRCYFKNTVTPPANSGWIANGNYTAGIDCMSLKTWVFEDNEFYDLHGRTGEGRSAIFVWRSSEDITIQRNTIINCDRGITLGLSNTAPVPHVEGALVRNNSIKVKAVNGFTADSGIELWTVKDVKIYNNTIWREDNPDGRGIRFINGIENAEVVNNLVRGGLQLENGTTLARNESNISRDVSPDYFLNVTTGDLRISTSAVDAIDAGVVLAEVTEDHAGNARDATPNIGAYESSLNPSLDNQAPSQPNNFSATALSGNQARLTWNASTDNISVTGYRIYRNGSLIHTTPGTQFTDQNLVTGTSYRYFIQAYDAAENISSNSNERTIVAVAAVSNVRDHYLNILPQINSSMKARLRDIKLRGESLGRDPGILGQWGDSITNSFAYLGVIGTNGISIPPSSGHDYDPILIWMKASQRGDGSVGGNDRSNPLWSHKGGDYSNASGWVTSQGLGAIQGAINRANPSWSLTMYGTNDVRKSGWSPQNYETQLRDFLQINIDQGVVPVVSTIPPMVNFDDEVDQANTVITNVANSMNLPLVDLYGLYTTLHPDDWSSTVISDDGVHPSATVSLSDLSDAPLRDSGYHIRTVLTLEMAEKLKEIIFDDGPPDEPNYPVLIITSPTPKQELIFNPSPQFTITHDSGAMPIEFSYVLDDQPDTIPDTVSEGSDTTISFTDQSVGVKYFHIRANSSEGWGPTIHFPVGNVRDFFLNTVSPIDASMKARLREIKLRGDSLNREEGLLGQWGDSITHNLGYLALTADNGIDTPPSSGHDYEPIFIWMKASQESDGSVGGMDQSSPLWTFKGIGNAPGSTVNAGLGSILQSIDTTNASWSLTMYGTNDVRTSIWNPEGYEKDLRRFLQINIDNGVIPVISTIPPMTGFESEVNVANSVITSVANSMNLPQVDLYGLYTSLHPDDWDETLITGDGVHPTFTGLATDFSDEALRNSGYHARTVLTLEVAEKLKAIVFEDGLPDGPNYPIIEVSSSTHPDQEPAFNFFPQFNITYISGAIPTEFSYVLDDQPGTIPDTIAEGSNTTISFPEQNSGVKYFHIRSNSSEGWGHTDHFEIRISDQPITLFQYKNELTSAGKFKDTAVSKLWGGNDNFGGGNEIQLFNDRSIDRSRGLFYFDISDRTETVPRAELVLSFTEGAKRDFQYLLYANSSSWVEGSGTFNNNNDSGVFYNNAPALSSETYGQGTVSKDANEVRIDVTGLVNKWISGELANHGFALRHLEKFFDVRIISKENESEDKRPALILWNDEPIISPSAPTQLAAQVMPGPQVSLSWVQPLNSPSQATSYRIYRNQESTPIATPTTTDFVDSNVQTNGVYIYRISVIDADGNESPLSKSITRTILPVEALPTDPSSPSTRLFAQNTPSSGLSWSTKAETYYAVESSSNMEEWIQTDISRSGNGLMEQATLMEILGNPLPENAFIRLHTYTPESTADEDNDGIPTWWEIRYSTGYNVSNASANSDSDSLSNLIEFQNGTDPTKADTDGDGIDDDDEITARTDPLIP